MDYIVVVVVDCAVHCLDPSGHPRNAAAALVAAFAIDPQITADFVPFVNNVLVAVVVDVALFVVAIVVVAQAVIVDVVLVGAVIVAVVVVVVLVRAVIVVVLLVVVVLVGVVIVVVLLPFFPGQGPAAYLLAHCR